MTHDEGHDHSQREDASGERLDPYIFGADQACFGCSPHHPTGFRLRLVREGDTIRSSFLPTEKHEGPRGIMHGGLVTTLADEVAAWAIIALLGKFGFTGALKAKFVGPVRVGKEVDARARIVRDGARVVVVGVELLQANELVYEGEFTFALVDRSGAERLLGGPLPPGWERFCR